MASRSAAALHKPIETSDIRNADGVPWHCFYGV